jgi:2-dehydro-3-deoxyphosphogluconate aldolase / (4S)-4-hydroxy-2-oxoglutarate aldolase
VRCQHPERGMVFPDEFIPFTEYTGLIGPPHRAPSAVIAEVARLAPHGAVIGAGTVLTRDDVARAAGAGARFMVTPALADSVAASVAGGIPVLAGVLTPTEALTAMGRGADAVKLFPSTFGGPSYLRALREPLPDLPSIPVGGVDVGLAGEYLRSGAVAVGVGSALVGDAIRGGDLDALRTRAAAFLSVAERSGSPHDPARRCDHGRDDGQPSDRHTPATRWVAVHDHGRRRVQSGDRAGASGPHRALGRLSWCG